MTFKNAISWFEIPATNLQRAQQFYETIMDTKLIPMDMGDMKMRMFPLDDMEGAGGALVENKDFYSPSSTAGTLIYLNGNPDVQQVVDRVSAAGGQVIVPKTEISPEYGFMAIIIDTEGNRIGFHSVPV
jgi:uncharacterized protein